MAMIDIEYLHPEEDPSDPTIRRRTNAVMSQYIHDLIFEMQMADISCAFKETVTDDGTRDVRINGRTIPQIIEGLEIRLLEEEDSCDLGAPRLVKFGRPTLDWKREWVEDVPDTIMKNAIAKVFADENKNRIDIINRARIRVRGRVLPCWMCSEHVAGGRSVRILPASVDPISPSYLSFLSPWRLDVKDSDVGPDFLVQRYEIATMPGMSQDTA